MINFIEHNEPGYPSRTIVNAQKADFTLAFAVDFKTPGEILTHKAAYGKYLSLSVGWHLTAEDLGSFILKAALRIEGKKEINFAGNSLNTLLSFGYSQDYADSLALNFLSQLNEQVFQLNIRSGGQGGFDEAFLKAGDKLSLNTICLAPKNWMYRDITGKDICSQEKFLARFGPQYDVTDLL